ncbi:MAG TPA: ABC transporter substrate-binding protein [Candidatus Prevotella stercoripullorum]|nr:ABC transporter substrate-binding protein [Candidatus Prevotella stercoripullorum]
MKHFSRYILLLCALLLVCTEGAAQDGKWREMHKVKAKETLYGIAREYGLTVDELVKANPEMGAPDYKLKKGDYIFIPYAKGDAAGKATQGDGVRPAQTVPAGALRVGVLLPLHNVDGDGRRMAEYYRGLLMACEDLKRDGRSISVSAWNVPVDADIYRTLVKDGVSRCDIIFGPLYSKQVGPLSFFSKDNGIKLVIPFSITGDDVDKNPNIFQVYQSPETFYGRAADHFAYRFKDYNVVVVDCNDKTSDKGVFTFDLRKKLSRKGVACNVTNISSGSGSFARAFSAVKPNIVVLNTARSPELGTVLDMLDALTGTHPELKVSLFGYTEWLMYASHYLDRFCRYDTYIPTNFYYNAYSAKTAAFERRYMSEFKSGMMDYLPRFAMTGYDHGMFFIGGMLKQGKAFDGSAEDKNALQTPLRFAKTRGGGYRNESLMFVHYNRDKSISIIKF